MELTQSKIILVGLILIVVFSLIGLAEWKLSKQYKGK